MDIVLLEKDDLAKFNKDYIFASIEGIEPHPERIDMDVEYFILRENDKLSKYLSLTVELENNLEEITVMPHTKTFQLAAKSKDEEVEGLRQINPEAADEIKKKIKDEFRGRVILVNKSR